MKYIVDQKWELDSLYPSDMRRVRIEATIKRIEKKIAWLRNELHLDNRMNNTESLVEMLLEVQQAQSEWFQIDDFLVCAYAENVLDNEVKKLMNESAVLKSELASCLSELDQVLVHLQTPIWIELINLPEILPMSFYLEERKQAIEDRLDPQLEKLIHALSVDGFAGWELHHEEMLNHLQVPLTIDGKKMTVPIQEAWHHAMFSAKRSAREEVATAIKEACEIQSELFASILNRIAGYRIEIYKQRGWTNQLKEAVEQNRIEEKSLQSMITTIEENQDLIIKYLQRKFLLEKIEQPAWYDLDAPSFAAEEKISYPRAKEIIIEQFTAFNAELGDFARNAFDNGWIESEDRPNKAGGGFCASLPVAKESRIFVTFRGSYQDVVTIAHELGHAYHNLILHEEPFFAQLKGTSVAETASTFMENLVMDAIIDQAESDEEKLALLEMKISNAIKYVGTIPNMFRFEQKLYEKRKSGVISAAELKQLIKETEDELYDGLLTEIDEYRWMYVTHFYDTEKAFYNIPYTIGYLFSNGIYEMSKERGPKFFTEYNELLRNSGRMTVEQLAVHYLDEDVTDVQFWQRSMQPVRNAVEEYLYMTQTYLEVK